jgi:tetratricopeptide (TPR) repeat protein
MAASAGVSNRPLQCNPPFGHPTPLRQIGETIPATNRTRWPRDEPPPAQLLYQSNNSILGELLSTVPLEPVSRARALLCHGMSQIDRSSAERVEATARACLELVTSLRDVESVADARDLLGDVLQAEGRREEALSEYQEDKRIALELTQRDPGNAGWLRDLSVSYNKVGSLLSNLPDRLQEALGEHQKSLEIAERLVTLDPANAQWAADLRIYLNWGLATAKARGGSRGSINVNYRKDPGGTLRASRYKLPT